MSPFLLVGSFMSERLYPGAALGVWISAGISGAHINPAVRCQTTCKPHWLFEHNRNRSLLDWLSGKSSHGKKCPVSPYSKSEFLFGPHIVTVYILAQVAGGFVGAASTYGQYLQPINIYEGSHTKRTIGTASLFAAFPVSKYHRYVFRLCNTMLGRIPLTHPHIYL